MTGQPLPRGQRTGDRGQTGRQSVVCPLPSVLCFIACCLLIFGCGRPGGAPIGTTGAKVKGRLLDNGLPVKVRPGEDVVVSFAPPNPADVTSTRGAASINPKDGSFAFFGTSSAAGLLSAGKYKVTVSSIYGSDGVDRFVATFGHDRTRLEAEVGPEPEQTFVIDIGRKTVMKQ